MKKVTVLFSTETNMKMFLYFLLICCFIFTGAVDLANATTYFGYNDFGGSYQDAEKSPTNSDDDLMCWAATASNVLNWTRWGDVYSTGANAEDDIFTYFQAHWTDVGGNMYFGVDWWFDGVNDSQGWSGWSQVDVPGGGFYDPPYFSDYYTWNSNDSSAMSNIDTYLHDGRGVGLGLSGPGGHAITCWGYEYDKVSGDYLGIYVTDSDDHKYEDGAADELRYYDVDYSSETWYLQNYYGQDDWYISEVHGLLQNPVPIPSAFWLLGSGLIAFAGIRRRLRN